MPEHFPDSSTENREKIKESDYNKAVRIKQNLMKLEKSVIDEVDEATQSARGAIQAMGFGISPVLQIDDDGVSGSSNDSDDDI